MKYVIIGNSAAGIGAVEGIRSTDTDGEIIIISDEKYHTYSRPLISYLLYGKTTIEKMKYRSNDFYEKKKVKLLHKKVSKIEKNSVILEDGDKISFDKLLVATGSRAFVPPMEGLETVEKKTSFMNLDDALALEKMISKDSKVLILGAGLIGLKAAEGIADKVADITVVDLADRILPSILDIKSSELVKNHIEKNDVKFILKQSVATFKGNTAVLSGGSSLEFDVLIIAVGVRPNVAIVKDAGGEVNRGIITDSFLKTSLENVYSAGDCTESIDITTGESKILALLPNAYIQGECAGINMAGGSKEYTKAIPMNAIGFFGLHMITAGSYAGEMIEVSDENNYKKLFVKDGLLKGFIIIGDVSRAGIYTSLIKEETPLESVDFELLKIRPQLLAFSSKDRKKKLGGVKDEN